MSEYTWYWLSTERMTVAVEVKDSTGIIFNTPPIVRKFVGQKIENLEYWMKKQPGFKMQEMRNPGQE